MSEISLAWHEILSWAVALVSTVLLVVQHRMNDNTKYYMVLQGILRACSRHSGYLTSVRDGIKESDKDVTQREFAAFVESECAHSLQLEEHIMGSMKSLHPDEDMPFSTTDFVHGRPSRSLGRDKHGHSRN